MSYTPDEPADTLFLERTFVAGDVITGTGFGIQIMLYLSCARYLWTHARQGKIQSLFILGYITTLIVVETIFTAVQARTIQDMYIDNRNFPGGPWQFFLTAESLAINAMFIATLFILNFMSDTLVLWRCWVIWTATAGGRRTAAIVMIIFPTIVLLASFVVGVLWAVKSSEPGLSLYSQLPVILGTSYYSLSLGVNVILSVLIAARLLAYRRQIMAALPADQAQYCVSLLAIFVESAAMYSICALLFLITYAVNSPMNQVFLGFTNSTQQIATYLIIYRVAEGRGLGGSVTVKATEGRITTGLGFARTKKDTDQLESKFEAHKDAPVSSTTIALTPMKETTSLSSSP